MSKKIIRTLRRMRFGASSKESVAPTEDPHSRPIPDDKEESPKPMHLGGPSLFAEGNEFYDMNNQDGLEEATGAGGKCAGVEDSEDENDLVGMGDARLIQHSNTRIAEAYTRLRDVSRDLSLTLKQYIRKHPDTPHITGDAFLSAFTDVSPNDAMFVSGEGFGVAIEQFLISRTNQKRTIASRVGQQMGRLYPLTMLILGMTSSAADIASFAPVKATANGLSLLFSTFESERTRYEDFYNQLERISYQARRVGEIQKHPEAVIGDLLLEKAIDLMTSIVEFFRTSISYFLRAYLQNVGKTLVEGPRIYADGKAKVNEAIAQYDQALLLQVANIILQSAAGEFKTGSEAQDPLLPWLRPSTWEVEAQLSTNRKLRAPGTLTWLTEVEEFRQWRLADEHRAARLWLTGLPGVGKSLIAAFLVDVLRAHHPDAYVLFFFCKHGEPMLENLENIVRTLAAQLAAADQQTYRYMTKLKADDFVLRTELAFLVRELLLKPITDCTRNVFIVVDGLDECSASHGETDAVQSFLSSLCDISCRLIVSSRSTSDIARAFHTVSTRNVGFEDSHRDIELFVKQRLSSSSLLSKGFERLGEDPSVYLVTRSQGNFLWVSVVLRLLEQAQSVKAFQSTLDNLPAEIGSLYGKALNRLSENGQLELAIAILEAIVVSARDLSLDELQFATEVIFGDTILDLTHFIKTECGSFLNIVPSGTTGSLAAQIAHETFRSYILGADLPKHRLDVPTSHGRLAAVCLTCLSKTDEDAMGFVDYSTTYWTYHLMQSTTLDSSNVLELVYKFIQGPSIQRWIRNLTYWNLSQDNIYIFDSEFLKAHDIVLNWVTSQVRSDTADDEDQPWLRWASESLTDSSAFSRMWCKHLARVWLDTHWTSLAAARYLFMTTLRFCRIFHFLGPSEPPTPTWPSGEDRTWRNYGGSDWVLATEEHCSFIASLGGYDPTSDTHTGNLAIVECRLNPNKCMDTFQSTLDSDPDNFVYYQCMAEFYAHSDEEKALSLYEKAMALDPENPPRCAVDYWSLLAGRKQKMGDTVGAVQAFRDALNQDPSVRDWYSCIAQIYEDQNDIESVKKTYREALDHSTERLLYWRAMAGICWKTHDWRAECAVWFEAMADDPPNAHDYRGQVVSRADSFRECQRLDPALEILDDAITRDPKSERFYKKARVPSFMAMTRWEDAIRDLEYLYATATDDDPFTMWERLADAYFAVGQIDKAIDEYKRDAEKRPDHSVVFRNLGNAFVASGNHVEAIRTLIKGVRLTEQDEDRNNTHPSWRYSTGHILYDLGIAYERSGRRADAQRQYEKAIEKYTAAFSLPPFDKGSVWRTEGRHCYRFGELFEKVGKLDRAKEQYGRAVNVFESTAYVEDDELEMSEAKEAEESLERVTGDSPGVIPEPDESTVIFRRGREIAQKIRINWAVEDGTMAPRERPL